MGYTVPTVTKSLDECFLNRPLRLLHAKGRPPEPVTLLSVQAKSEIAVPLAVLCHTRGNRHILWPAVPAHAKFESENGTISAIDHVTLENERTHFTSFTESHDRKHEDHDWRLAELVPGIRLWLLLAAKHGELTKECAIYEGIIRSPVTDAARRNREFVKFAQAMQTVIVPFTEMQGDYIAASICILRDSPQPGDDFTKAFPMGAWWDDWIEGWADGSRFPTAPVIFPVGNLRLLVMIACPPGRIRNNFYLGGPISGRT